MGNKTYLEMANETLTALINKGLISVPYEKGMDWKERNRLMIHTVGWAHLELYREIKDVTEKAKLPPKKPKPTGNLKQVKP
jgi:hypothetical protein